MMHPISQSAYKLFHNGALALAEAERNGIRIDVGYCKKAQAHLEKKEKQIQRRIFDSKPGKLWKRSYGSMTKLGAVDQLRTVLHDYYGVDAKGSLDKEHLAKIKNPLVNDILEFRKIHKARTTYLEGILKHVVDGFLHPDFNLHLASTYRSSSSNPNFQNIPIRDPEVAKLVRRAFIPRKGHRLVEADFKGIEVQIAACYHKDPTMIRYLESKYDMHSEMAAECYLLPTDEVPKLARYCAKNRFVFPAFYGSYYKQIGPDLWGAIKEFGLETADGTSMSEHLDAHGIRNYADFEDHIKAVEDNFWNNRFAKYSKWKEHWWKNYLKQGWFKTKTGFICRGKMKRNEAINYPIQGSAFHCLLWSFTEMSKSLRRSSMSGVQIGQIHDSALGDVPENEVEDYVALYREISTQRLREAWEWIILPLDIEVDATDVDKSWYTKKAIEG